MNLVGCNPDLLIRNIGKVDVATLGELLRKVDDATAAAKHVRVATAAGGDIEFDNEPGRDIVTADWIVHPGEIKMMPGQVSWSPRFETINGTIVVDGTINPPLGFVTEPIKFTVEKGKVVSIDGGTSAKAFADGWLALMILPCTMLHTWLMAWDLALNSLVMLLKTNGFGVL